MPRASAFSSSSYADPGSVSVCPSSSQERQSRRLEHAGDELVELEERIARIVAEALLQVAPFALPLVFVEAGLLHA